MTPPYVPHHVAPNDDAPISQWYFWDSFDSAAECKAALKRQTDLLQRDYAHGKKPEIWDIVMQLLHGHCIATDDPRLKGN